MADKDKIYYAVSTINGNLLKDIGRPEDFAVGHLPHLEGGDHQIHVFLPPAFGMDPKVLTVIYVPVETRGAIRANHKLIDNDGKNLLHDVVMADVMEFCDPQMDKVRRSSLGLELLPVPEIIHSLPEFSATSELQAQLVTASIKAYRREKALSKAGLKTSVAKSSDHSKRDNAHKSNNIDTQKSNQDDGHHPKHPTPVDRSAHTDLGCRE